MGAGKSLISKRLAKLTKKKVVSTDQLIEEREGKKIPEIFQDSGEAYFRKVEKGIIAMVAKQNELIIDCGGGVVLDPENLAHLKARGIVFYLSATPEEIYRRVKNEDHRPLLRTERPQERIEELLAKRKSFYEQADHMVETNQRPPDDICQEILDIMQGSQGKD